MTSSSAGHVQQRRFGITPATVAEQMSGDVGFSSNESFEPLPPPTGPFPFRLTLNSVVQNVPADVLAFHAVGDSGGVQDPNPQLHVANAMTADLANAPAPSFFYHLGDVVYFNGDEKRVRRPVLRALRPLPGADRRDPRRPRRRQLGRSERRLADRLRREPLLEHAAPRPAGAGVMVARPPDQPNVYSRPTRRPFVTIVGLYTNVPLEGGSPRTSRLARRGTSGRRPPPPLVIALHHPPYSADANHGSSAPMRSLLDGAFAAAGQGRRHGAHRPCPRLPAVHRTIDGRQVPYIVAGAGGYHNLHAMASDAVPGMQVMPDCVLEQFAADRWGFLRFSVTAGDHSIAGEYIGVDKTGAAASVDSFRLHTQAHTVT